MSDPALVVGGSPTPAPTPQPREPWLHYSWPLAAGFLLLGLLGFLQAPERWIATALPSHAAPTWYAPFGANGLGQDLFARWLMALGELWRTSLPGSALAFAIALVVAMAASPSGGRGEPGRLLLDLGDSLPGLLILLAGAAVFGPAPWVSPMLIALALWPEAARGMSQQWRATLAAEHVVMARTLGVPTPQIWLRHICRPMTPVLLRNAVALWILSLKWGVLMGFLGLAEQARPSLGNMLYQGLSAARLGAPRELLIALLSVSCLTFASLLALQTKDRVPREWRV